MLRRRGWQVRTWAMLWAVLQFALPAVAGVADAAIERDSRTQVTHVESTSSPTCRPAHAAECALCQLVAQHAAPASGGAPPQIALRVVSPIVAAALAARSGALGRLPLARAPPLV